MWDTLKCIALRVSTGIKANPLLTAVVIVVIVLMLLLLVYSADAAERRLLLVHLPGGREVLFNPHEIVSLRIPPVDYLHEGVKCLIQSTDGKNSGVIEDCREIERVLEQMGEGGSKL